MSSAHLPPPPPGVQTDGSGSGVRRVNNTPLIIIGGVVLAFALVLAVVAGQRAARGLGAAADVGGVASLSSPEAALHNFNLDAGIIGEGSAGPSIKVLTADQRELPPVPPLDGFAEDLRKRRMAQLEEALAATTGVQRVAGGGSSAPPADRMRLPEQSEEDPAMAMERRRQQSIRGNDRFDDQAAAQYQRLASTLGSAGPGGDAGTETRAATGDLGRFNGPSNRWTLDSTTEAPTRYQLRAGYVIPGVMISGINSDLPGQVVAQVSQPVYDNASGRDLLIPQGTRLVGQYESSVGYGQRRVFIAWQRMIFPDGRARDIGSMSGADPAGYAGFDDKVNQHFVRLFGSAFLLSGIVAGMQAGDVPTGASDTTSLSYSARQALANEMGRVATKMLERNLSISPTIEIRPGYRFNIMVSKDIDLDGAYAVNR